MLPDRSKRFARTEDGALPRLKLTENWQLLMIALLMAGLFIVIFPRQTLIEELYAQPRLDGLTLSYIENLARTDKYNLDLRILIVRSHQDRLNVHETEEQLSPVLQTGRPQQRQAAELLLLESYMQALQAAQSSTTAAVSLYRHKLLQLLANAQQETWSQAEQEKLAAAAFLAEEPKLGLSLLQAAWQAGSESVVGQDLEHAAEHAALPDQRLREELVRQGKEALARGRHALAANYFLLARTMADQPATARTLLQQGIDSLMAANLYAQAMQAAHQSLGDLADDPVTLRYLTRIALAAGEPQQAAIYARRLVFQAPVDNTGFAGVQG